MKKRSALCKRSVAAGGSGKVFAASFGCGMRGMICFLLRYFGQLP